MPRKRNLDLEQAIEWALAPGVFIGHRNGLSFVEDLEALQETIEALAREGATQRQTVLPITSK